jgi:hypothetical protein
MEVGFSNLRELFHEAAPYSYDLQELGSFHRQYERLMAHWQRVPRAHPGRGLCRPGAPARSGDAQGHGLLWLDFVPAMLDIASSRRGVSTASAVSVRQGIVARTTPSGRPMPRNCSPWPTRWAAETLFEPPAAVRDSTVHGIRVRAGLIGRKPSAPIRRGDRKEGSR